MDEISLTLYIISNTAISKRAIRNIKSICSSKALSAQCCLEIIDLKENPGVAEKEKILATPLLIKNSPAPQRRIIGDLSNKQKVISALELNLELRDDEQD